MRGVGATLVVALCEEGGVRPRTGLRDCARNDYVSARSSLALAAGWQQRAAGGGRWRQVAEGSGR